MKSRVSLPSWLALSVTALILLVLPRLIGTDYYLHIAIISLVFVILATSLDILVGYSGLLSLCHTAFFAFGAYAAALLFLHFQMSLWLTMFAGGVFAASIAWLLGLLVLSVRGHRFIITTVIFAEIGRLIAYNWTDLTQGQDRPVWNSPPCFRSTWVAAHRFQLARGLLLFSPRGHDDLRDDHLENYPFPHRLAHAGPARE
ncbi:ABC-type branched-subunit amino acid transport system permease subunit [Bradyrhizobium sp. F1.13.4]